MVTNIVNLGTKFVNRIPETLQPISIGRWSLWVWFHCYQIRIFFSAAEYLLQLLYCIVLKLNSDRPVEPDRPRTGDMTGSVCFLDRLCNWTSQNRRNSLRTGKNRWLGRFGEPDRVNTQCYFNWYKNQKNSERLSSGRGTKWKRM